MLGERAVIGGLRNAGRYPAIAAVGFAVALAAGYPAWHGSVGIDDHAVAVTELMAVTTGLIGLVAITPRMATWEASGVDRVRRLATRWMMGVVFAATAITPIIWVTVMALPDGLVPQSSQFTMDELTIEMSGAQAANALLMLSIGAITVAALGRLYGLATALAVYVVLIWASAATGWSVPYATLPNRETALAQWLIAALVFAIAVQGWLRTGGASALARHLDPRS